MKRRRVTGTELCGASRYTGYVDKSLKLHLSCGHYLIRKRSAYVPHTALCVTCEQIEKGQRDDG